MCVIMFINKVRPTDLMVEKAFDANDDGAGIAWREEGKSGREVVWKKDLNREQVMDLCKTVPTPYTVHFRVASIGGVRPELTHPFPVTHKVEQTLSGRTKGYVLFHNGHWTGWAETSREAAIRSNTKIPVGRWSDSRAMAWLCSIYGNGFMEFLPEQRGVVFGPNDSEIFTGPGWVKVNEVWCSNDWFMSRGRGHVTRVCRYGQCQRYDVDSSGYCPIHPNGVLKPLDMLDSHTQKVLGPGGAPPVTPFAPGQFITVETAERLHKEKNERGEKKLSKRKLQKIRKAHANLDLKGRAGDKARRDLVKLSLSLTSSGLVH